jgi:hypothetical protein
MRCAVGAADVALQNGGGVRGERTFAGLLSARRRRMLPFPPRDAAAGERRSFLSAEERRQPGGTQGALSAGGRRR